MLSFAEAKIADDAAKTTAANSSGMSHGNCDKLGGLDRFGRLSCGAAATPMANSPPRWFKPRIDSQHESAAKALSASARGVGSEHCDPHRRKHAGIAESPLPPLLALTIRLRGARRQMKRAPLADEQSGGSNHGIEAFSAQPFA